jgi:hypothetical protein
MECRRQKKKLFVHGESDLELFVMWSLVFEGVMNIESRRNKRRLRIWMLEENFAN